MIILTMGLGTVAHLVGCSLSTCEGQSYTEAMGVHSCHPSTQEVEMGGAGVQGHPQLYNEFKASLGLMRLSQKVFFKLVHY